MAPISLWLVARCVVPRGREADPCCVRSEQLFGGIEPVPGGRLVRTTDPISEQLTRTDTWEMGVPDLVRLLGHHDPLSFDSCIPPVEQT